MRNNQPVTNVEFKLNRDHFLISRTDLKGYITYANASFVEASGFTADELEGANHNIVRHPDMPPVAFANLWDTIQAGETWVGLVKNRRKDGGFYWVKAHVVPFIEDGEHKGYVSVRTRPERHEIEAAEEAYALIRQGEGDHLGLDRGRLYHKGFFSRLQRLFRLNSHSIGGRFISQALVSLLLLLASMVATVNGVAEEKTLVSVLGMQLGILVLGGAALLGLAHFNGRQISRPLMAARDFILQVAAGNLAARLDHRGSAEVGLVTDALDVMLKSLGRIASDAHHGVDTVRPATQDIALASEELAARIEQQAAFLHETVTTMQEIMVAVDRNAESCRAGSELSSNAVSTVEHNGRMMNDVVATMDRISLSSEEMVKIIDVIDSIAFQTNILALNASVEAARAGEQGRGFAVVADEVRNLAGRSAEAANEVRNLINRVAGDISEGATLVSDAEQSITEVVEMVKRVRTFISAIEESSSQQSIGINEINQAVSQMEEVTQENAIRVQATADAARVLDLEMNDLAHAIEVFQMPEVEPESESH